MSTRDRADQAAELPYEGIPAGPIARRGASHKSGHVIVVEVAATGALGHVEWCVLVGQRPR
ncbi:MAG: hypothetical protein ACXVH3_07370 [Solirubrobacteraceae bacterium]